MRKDIAVFRYKLHYSNFRKEATSTSIEHFLQQQTAGELAISHWTRIEFSSVLARDVRMGVIEPQAAIDLDAQFEMTDALHLAIANNRGARTFYTLDRKLLRAGRLLGLPVAAGFRGRE